MTDETCTLEPPVLDTYALVYAFSLLFLVPGSILIGNLQFRTYTFSYVSLVTVPFVLGLLAVFLSDCTESLATRLKRSAILVPLIVVTGVGIMFTSALFLYPANSLFQSHNFELLTWMSVILLVLLAAPLLPAFVRRLRVRTGIRGLVQLLALAAAIAAVAVVVWLTLARQGTIDDLARKDVVIYIIGGLTWYLPSFGLAAGIWRRLGLV